MADVAVPPTIVVLLEHGYCYSGDWSEDHPGLMQIDLGHWSGLHGIPTAPGSALWAGPVPTCWAYLV